MSEAPLSTALVAALDDYRNAVIVRATREATGSAMAFDRRIDTDSENEARARLEREIASAMRSCPTPAPASAKSEAFSGFLFAARVVAQSDRVVAGALQRIESDVHVVLGIVKDDACSPERQLAAGMGLAVVQHLVGRASEEAMTTQLAAVREVLKR